MFFSRRPVPNRASLARRANPGEVRSRISGTVYAIGDIHGRLDCFQALIDIIKQDAAALNLGDEKPTIVLLGDLIDRGPQSAACLDRAIALCGEAWCDTEVIKGNHEQALLQFLDDPGVGPAWIQHGGAATLLAYGVDVNKADPSKGWLSVQSAFAAALPDAHRDFCASMKLSLERDDYIFVHAGVRPGIPLEAQTEADLLWIRQDFLRVEVPYPNKVIVHGHTPRREPDLRRWRIGIDTGAYGSGILTAVRLRGVERKVLLAR